MSKNRTTQVLNVLDRARFSQVDDHVQLRPSGAYGLAMSQQSKTQSYISTSGESPVGEVVLAGVPNTDLAGEGLVVLRAGVPIDGAGEFGEVAVRTKSRVENESPESLGADPTSVAA